MIFSLYCGKVTPLLQSKTCSCAWVVEGHVHRVDSASVKLQSVTNSWPILARSLTPCMYVPRFTVMNLPCVFHVLFLHQSDPLISVCSTSTEAWRTFQFSCSLGLDRLAYDCSKLPILSRICRFTPNIYILMSHLAPHVMSWGSRCLI